MKRFAALLRLEFMNNESRRPGDKAFSRVRRIAVSLIGTFCIVALFLYAVSTVMNLFIKNDMLHEFVTLFVLIMLVFHVISGTSMATKVLFTKVDISILKLPVDGEGAFLPKFLYLYIKQLSFDILIFLPTLILFGTKTGQGATFFLMTVLNTLFLPVIPLLFSVILSIPTMWVIKTFKNRFIILTILYAIVVAIGFIIYTYALRFVLKIFESENGADIFDKTTILNIRVFSSQLYLSSLFKNCILMYNYAKSALILVAVMVVLLALVYIFASKLYFKFLISNKNEKAFQKRVMVRSKESGVALMSKEFKNIFRSPNYAFQYLTVVVTTPLMVYFSTAIATNVGSSVIGNRILPGIIVFVLITYLSMGTSFSANAVTMEGNKFFITKIIPVNFTKQITMKFIIYLVISIPAIFVSCLILFVTGMVNLFAATMLAISLSFLVTGNICSSITMDIKRPQFQYLENGEVVSTTNNVSASIGIGFVIAFIMGLAGIVLSLFVSVPAVYLVLFGFGVPYAGVELYRLFYKLEKRYYAIEV